MKLGEFIRNKRKEMNLTLKQLAAQIDLSHTYLSQIELGERNIQIPELKKISNELNVNYIELLIIANYVTEDEIKSFVEG